MREGAFAAGGASLYLGYRYLYHLESKYQSKIIMAVGARQLSAFLEPGSGHEAVAQIRHSCLFWTASASTLTIIPTDFTWKINHKIPWQLHQESAGVNSTDPLPSTRDNSVSPMPEWHSHSAPRVQHPPYQQIPIRPHSTSPPLNRFLNLPDTLNVTTRRDLKIKSPPVAGFRPRRSPFFLIWNLPKLFEQTALQTAFGGRKRRLMALKVGGMRWFHWFFALSRRKPEFESPWDHQRAKTGS